MNTSQFLHIITHPEQITPENIGELEEVISAYPFFQSARAIYVKALQKNNHFKFNNALKKTAAYTVDRKVLFHFITNPVQFSRFSKNINVLEKQKTETLVETVNIDEKEIAKQKLNIGNPIKFTRSELHSFNEWLQLTSKKTIQNNEEAKVSKKTTLINKFIELSPRIKPVNKNIKTPNVLYENTLENKEIMTETLARVYLEQKKYDKAIQAYHILSLKYPKKSGFFADQIKAIKILQNK